MSAFDFFWISMSMFGWLTFIFIGWALIVWTLHYLQERKQVERTYERHIDTTVGVQNLLDEDV